MEKPSLYDRLGGVYGIATVVDDFIDRIMVDPRLPGRQMFRFHSGRDDSGRVVGKPFLIRTK
jgi:truncated hemoglobin YjbI